MQLFRTPHPPKRTCGSMGNGSIAGAMNTAPRSMRKSFATPVTTSLPTPVPVSVPGSGSLNSSIGTSVGGSAGLINATTAATTTAATQSMLLSQLISSNTTDTQAALSKSSSMDISDTLPYTDSPSIPLGQIRTHTSSIPRGADGVPLYALAYPENDEEAVAVESPCTLVLRPFAQPVIVTPPRNLLTIPSPGGFGRTIALESLGMSYVPPCTIISLCILPDRLLVVLGTGVVEAYRYYTSDVAKNVLAVTATQPSNVRRTYITQKRRNALELARKAKAVRLAKAEAQALLESSALER